MDPTTFDKLTKPLLKYNKRLDREQLRSKIKQCEHCDCVVKDQVIVAKVCRLGNELQHTKHICYPCKAILFDGSLGPKRRRLN